MRIGILTQKLENNYGGILQNYALQTVLMRLGHIPFTIDYRPGDSYFWYILAQTKILLRKLKRENVEYRPYSGYKSYRSKFTTPFIKKYIKTTHRLQILTPFIPIIYNFKLVIVGSDQVWRKEYNVLRNTYLSFVKGNIVRLAYAASFGIREWNYSDSQTTMCRKLVKKFRSVSTREIIGVELCRQFLQVEATHVLDPTMLLTKENYIQLCTNVKVKNKRLLFAYILDISDEKRLLLSKIAKDKGLELEILSAEDKLSCTVEEWLAYFRDSEIVITDSFHGTVFSIIFQKEFYSIGNKSRGNDRFDSLLGLFHLENRLISDNIFNDTAISWERVSHIMHQQQKNSLDFLINNVF